MIRINSYHTSKEPGRNRLWAVLWKGTALAVIGMALFVGIAGCSLDDIVMPVGGDIPFEENITTKPDMGAVDDVPTVPNDDFSFDGIDFRSA